MAASGLPMSFGGGVKGGAAAAPVARATKRRRDDVDSVADAEERDKEGERGAREPSSDSHPPDQGDDSDEDGDLGLPISRAAAFEPCERSVTCVAVDRSGTRLASGSRDGRVKLYDFGGARDDLRSFRSFYPLLSGSLTGGGGGGEGAGDGEGEGGATPPVVSMCWLPATASSEASGDGGGGAGGGGAGGGGAGGGGLLLVACSDARLVLCDREGRKLAETARGDGYLSDPKNTKGHTAPVTCCCFLSPPPTRAPSAVDVASGSEDGTVRIWSVVSNEGSDKSPWAIKQRVVIKVPATGGGNRRTKVTAVAYLAATATASRSSPSLLVAGTEDGAIHCWDPRARKGRPAAAGAAVTGPTARLLGTSARTMDWCFVAGVPTSTTRSVARAHGGDRDRGDPPSTSSGCAYVSPAITALAPPPPHLDDGTRVASRGEDGTVKLWDFSEGTRGKKVPLVWSSARSSSSPPPPSSGPRHPLLLPAEEPTTGLAWSPDGRFLATGTSEGTVALLSSSEATGGRLVRSVDVVEKIREGVAAGAGAPFAPSSSSVSIVPVCWHPKLNQIFVGVSDPAAAAAAAGAAKQQKRKGFAVGGVGGTADAPATTAAAAAAGGRVVALFSPKTSERGVLLALSRRSKKKAEQLHDGGAAATSRVPREQDIYNPHALPLYRAERKPGVPLAAVGGSKRKAPEASSAPPGSAAPLPGRGGAGPALGAGSGGRLGASGGTLLTQHVLKSRGGFGLVAPSEEGDIRERMLAHGDLARKDPEMAALTRAYRETQPEKVFQEKSVGAKGDGDDGDGGGDRE